MKIIESLMAVEELMRTGVRMPMCFNESLTLFIPKGEAELDREEVLRAATGDDQYDWDPAKFERFHKVQLTENHMHSEFISCPIVPGYTREIDRSHMRGEKLLDANKDWIMRVAGIGSYE